MRISLLIYSLITAPLWLQSQHTSDTLRAVIDNQGRFYLTEHITESNPLMANLDTRSAAIYGNNDHYVDLQRPREVVSRSYYLFDTARYTWYQVPEARPIVYKVRPKETVFRIARRHFAMPIEALMMMNDLDTTELSIDQVLLVGWYKELAEPTMDASTSLLDEEVDPFGGEVPLLVKGTGFWDKTYPNDGHLFAMHRTARINSLIELTNPMFDRKITIKVIGRIPGTFRKDIDLIISPAVAETLGIIDPRFYIHMRYLE